MPIHQAMSPNTPKSQRRRPKKPSIIIPQTPNPVNVVTGPSFPDRELGKARGGGDSDQGVSGIQTFLIDSSSTLGSSINEQTATLIDEDSVYDQDEFTETDTLSCSTMRPSGMADVDVLSPDIVAIASVFAGMKRTMGELRDTFGRLDAQTDRMVALVSNVRVLEQVKHVRKTVEDMIARQTDEIRKVQLELEKKVKDAVAGRIRREIYATIHEQVAIKVEERVRAELQKQIPKDLRQQVKTHKRQIQQVKSDLHNSEARRFNSNVEATSLNAPLRPLLRPLPTPEQSPTYVVPKSVSFSFYPATPVSPVPRVPAPTPIATMPSAYPYISSSLLAPPRSALETIPCTPSPLFPRDLKSLFALGPEAARSLLRDYGLGGESDGPSSSDMASTMPTPTTENPKPKALPDIVISNDDDEKEIDSRERDLNRFMAHIGVPFLMIPAPKGQNTPESRTEDTVVPPVIQVTAVQNAEGRRMRPPLIINTGPRFW